MTKMEMVYRSTTLIQSLGHVVTENLEKSGPENALSGALKIPSMVQCTPSESDREFNPILVAGDLSPGLLIDRRDSCTVACG